MYLKSPPKQGGTLEVLRGVLPVDVQAGRRDVAVVEDLLKARGKLYSIEGGGQLHIHTVQTNLNQVTVRLSVLSNALWSYDGSLHHFEMTDAKGRQFYHYPQTLQTTRMEFRATDGLLLAGGSPVGGLTALPWSGLVSLRPPPGKAFCSGGFLSFNRVGDVGRPARLTLHSARRVRVEVPFEFHKLPLP